MASVLRVASLWHNAAELQIKIAAVATIREIACFILNTPFRFCVGPGAGSLLIDAILGSIVAEPHRNRQVLDGEVELARCVLRTYRLGWPVSTFSVRRWNQVASSLR